MSSRHLGHDLSDEVAKLTGRLQVGTNIGQPDQDALDKAAQRGAQATQSRISSVPPNADPPMPSAAKRASLRGALHDNVDRASWLERAIPVVALTVMLLAVAIPIVMYLLFRGY